MPGFAAVRSSAASQGGLLAIAAALAAFVLAYAFAPSNDGYVVRTLTEVCVDSAGRRHYTYGEDLWYPPSYEQTLQDFERPWRGLPPLPAVQDTTRFSAFFEFETQRAVWVQRGVPHEFRRPLTLAVQVRTVPDRSNPDGVITAVGEWFGRCP